MRQGRDKGCIEMIKEDLKAAINDFNVRPVPQLWSTAQTGNIKDENIIEHQA